MLRIAAILFALACAPAQALTIQYTGTVNDTEGDGLGSSPGGTISG